MISPRVLIWLLFVSLASSVDYTVTAGATWQNRLTSLLPGDVLTFLPQTPGTPYTYTTTSRNGFVLKGDPTNPIIVQGAPGESITIAMNANQNVVEIIGQYFIFQNLRLTATANAPGAIGLRLQGNTSHAIIRNVVVFNVPETAFTANAYGNRYVNVTFDRCEAYNTGGTGECFYVGCQGKSASDVACEFINGALINSYCHDTCKPNACTGGSLGSGYQVKGWGSYGNLVRNNVCARVSSVCVLLYDDWDLGVNIVENNWIYGSVTDAGIQVAAGAIIRNNVIYGNSKGINVQRNTVNLQAGKLNRNIVIVGNTIVNNKGTGVALPTFSPTAGTRIVNNVVIEDTGNAFTGQAQTGVTWLNNGYRGGSPLTGVEAVGVRLVGTASTEFQDPAGFNFHPKAGSALLAVGAALNLNNDVDYDFSCTKRSAIPSIGAYESSTGAALSLGFQASCGNAPTPVPAGSPTPAAGSPTPAAGSPTTTNSVGVVLPSLFLATLVFLV